MERNKTSVIVLLILAGFFFIAIAMVFNTSARRNIVLKKNEEIIKKTEYLNMLDLTIYWIGDFPPELESLKKRTNIIRPEEITKDNMPIRSSTFRISVTDEQGNHNDIVPRKYTEYMLIVITTGDGYSDEAKEVLRNCIADNGVPVIAIGDKACNLLGTVLIHGAGYAPEHSIFYKVKEGYHEPYLDPDAVKAGGVVLADDLCGKLCVYFNDRASQKWAEASERISSAASSAASSASDAETATSESVGESSVSETTEREKLLLPPA